MAKKSYWNLLVLFGVLCQGIIGTLSENEIDESSDLLVRQKRVVNLLPGRDVRAQIRHFPFVVSIKRFRLSISCVGVILTQHTVLTAANCVMTPITSYRVYSGSALMSRDARPAIHNITDKRANVGNHPHRPADGIALITVFPPFTYASNTHNIQLYSGNLPPGLYATVAGWGCNPTGHPGTAHPDRLRSIIVPLISNEECIILYRNHFAISDSDICTLDAGNQQYCGANDAGAPLIIQVNYITYLAGIHLWKGEIPDRSNPDVFVNLQHPNYRSWILETIRNLEAHLRT